MPRHRVPTLATFMQPCLGFCLSMPWTDPVPGYWESRKTKIQSRKTEILFSWSSSHNLGVTLLGSPDGRDGALT